MSNLYTAIIKKDGDFFFCSLCPLCLCVGYKMPVGKKRKLLSAFMKDASFHIQKALESYLEDFRKNLFPAESSRSRKMVKTG